MKRQPQGIPVGGQFTADRKGEPSGSLNQFDIPSPPEVDPASKGLAPVEIAGLSEEDHGRFLNDADALADQGLRGKIQPSRPDTYGGGEDASLSWQSAAGNDIQLSPPGVAVQEVRDIHTDGKFRRSVRVPAIEKYLPRQADASSVARAAKKMDRLMSTARALADTEGFKPLTSTKIEAVKIDVEGNVQFTASTSSGTQFEIHHTASDGKSEGYVVTDRGLAAMDTEDTEMYMSRLVGRRLGATLGERPNEVMSGLCKDLRWNFRNINDGK